MESFSVSLNSGNFFMEKKNHGVNSWNSWKIFKESTKFREKIQVIWAEKEKIAGKIFFARNFCRENFFQGNFEIRGISGPGIETILLASPPMVPMI